VISPASDAHVQKYSSMDDYAAVDESPSLYLSKIKCLIDAVPPSRTQWVANILSGEAEQEKLLLRDEEFVVLPEMKWNGTDVSEIYFICILRDQNLKSLRDLRKEHIPMLVRIREAFTKILAERFPDVGYDKIRTAVHYPPTYYWLHIHAIHNDAVSMTRKALESDSLESVIDNLKNIDSEYYAKRTIRYFVPRTHPNYVAIFGEPKEGETNKEEDVTVSKKLRTD